METPMKQLFGCSIWTVIVLALGFGVAKYAETEKSPIPEHKASTETTLPFLAAQPPTVTVTNPQTNSLRGWNIYFSPKGGCEEALLKSIADAKKTIRVSIYVLTSDPIAKALVEAKKRGVDVQVITDSQEYKSKRSKIIFLVENGITVYVDNHHTTFHHKYIIIDEVVVGTGSYNYTFSAENLNAENLMIGRSKQIASAYLKDWNEHKSHSKVLTDPKKVTKE